MFFPENIDFMLKFYLIRSIKHNREGATLKLGLNFNLFPPFLDYTRFLFPIGTLEKQG